jgi:hypothetical protein
MQRTVITSEQCGDMLATWLRSRCNSSKAKSVATSVGYKYTFFSPAKKLHLFEELTFLYVSLAVDGANRALEDNFTIQKSVDAFLAIIKVNLLDAMAEGDAGFRDRFAERMGSYFELLQGGGDAIGVAGEFLCGLFKSPDARLRLVSALSLVSEVAAAQLSLEKVFEQLQVCESLS